jgi:hypothetical protein
MFFVKKLELSGIKEKHCEDTSALFMNTNKLMIHFVAQALQDPLFSNANQLYNLAM